VGPEVSRGREKLFTPRISTNVPSGQVWVRQAGATWVAPNEGRAMNDYAGNVRRVLRSQTAGAANNPLDAGGLPDTGGA
jgi:hypothetical protein